MRFETIGSSEVDVAIVGAGVSGAYCAYRLKADRPDLRVAVFEGSARLGGRLKSLDMLAGIPAELGGAFVTSMHRNIIGLISTLGLDLIPLRWQRRGLYVRGQHTNDEELAARASYYDLWPDELEKTPSALLVHALGQIAPGFERIWPMSRQADRASAALETLSFAGRPLRDWSFRALLRQVLSAGAYELLSTTMGSSANFGPYSALDVLRTIRSELTPQRAYIVNQGYEAVPRCLLKQSGAELILNQKLEVIEGGADSVTLRFARRSEPVHAGAAILALPRAALTALSFNIGNGAADQLRDCIASVEDVDAFKLFMTFRESWWPAVAVAKDGRGIAATYTDLAIQQCYLADARPRSSALCLAAFADGDRTSTWRNATPSQASAEALEQLRELHLGLNIPDPERVAMQMWSSEGEGAAWHAWKPGVNSRAVGARLRQARSPLRLMVCGEAFSMLQGWVEGAVNSAELLLQERFGLDRAPWIDEDYPLYH